MRDSFASKLRRWLAFSAVALGFSVACEPSPAADPPEAAPAVATPSPAPAVNRPSTRIDAGFRSRKRLSEHFAKHGAEFGKISRDEYLRLAQALRDAPVGGDVLELRRDDGTISRFDRKTGAFLAFDVDGTIRTFFRPNDGESYFQRQARRRNE